jgi:hypothetical protein
MDLSQRLRATTEAMASQCSVPTSLWNEHSNACLDAIDEIGRQSNRAWLAETERDALDAAHKDMAGRLARMGEENERLRAGLTAAIRAANLALFVINKQGVMPNSSWESGFKSDLATATAAMSAVEQSADKP